MARNRHPEETVNLILDAAQRLFVEKGYEHTSIQDIINQLGGLSKGAIYHHFKSKEEILDAVMNRITAESNKLLAEIRDRTDLTGSEKLKTLFRDSLGRSAEEDVFAVAPDLGNNPMLLYSTFRDTVDVVAPNYILPILKEGIEDGSIETDYPEELAELIILAANIWMNPMVFQDSAERSNRKFIVFCQIMKSFGLDIVDEAMLNRLKQLAMIYQKNK